MSGRCTQDQEKAQVPPVPVYGWDGRLSGGVPQVMSHPLFGQPLHGSIRFIWQLILPVFTVSLLMLY